MTHPVPDRKEPTLGQISRDYAKGLALIDDLRRQRDELLTALKAAMQFLGPGIDRGPAVNGWTNTVDLVDTAILHAEPPRPARDEAP